MKRVLTYLLIISTLLTVGCVKKESLPIINYEKPVSFGMNYQSPIEYKLKLN